MKKFYSFVPLAILLTLIAAASLAIYNSSTKRNFSKENLIVGEKAKKFRYRYKLPEFALPSLFASDSPLSRKDLLNNENRYSVINFFASWCTTCLAEHEAIMRLSQEKSINLYGIAWHDFEDSATTFLQENGNPFIKIGLDSKGLFTKILGINGVPETILVDSLGTVVLRYQGNLDEATIFEILNFVNKKK